MFAIAHLFYVEEKFYQIVLRKLCCSVISFLMYFYYIQNEKQEDRLKDMKRYLVVKGEMITVINEAR